MVTFARGVLLVTLVASCGAPPARPTPPVALPAPSSPSPVVAASAALPPSPSATAAAAMDPPEDEEQNNLAGTIDADGPPAPCDFARNYRGQVGQDAVAIALSRAGAKLRGFAVYDAGFGEIELAGTVQPDGTLALTERNDGKDIAVIRGSCASGTGVITGSWIRGTSTGP